MTTIHWMLHIFTVFLLLAVFLFMKDSLTGLWIRRLYQLLYPIMRRRNGYVIFLDIDHFKIFNEKFGHPVGDKVLRRVGRVFRKHAGPFSFRYGGDEMCCLFFSRSKSNAIAIAEAIRKEIAGKGIVTDDTTQPITVSLTVAHYEQYGRMRHLQKKAKHGRNGTFISNSKGVLKRVPPQ